jgi:hypothetical protein
MKIAGKIPATQVHTPLMFRFWFWRTLWKFKRIKTYVQIIHRFAQNEGRFWTGVDQA